MNNRCPLTLNQINEKRKVMLRTGGRFTAFNADALLEWITQQQKRYQLPTHPLTREQLSVSQVANVVLKASDRKRKSYFNLAPVPLHNRVRVLRSAAITDLQS